MVGGDFNLLRSVADKNNGRVDQSGMQRFNDWIADLELRELDRVGARFTWTNKQVNPTRSVLDRVLVAPEWELGFPLATLQAITRIGSDHVPLLLSYRDERPDRPLAFGLSRSVFTIRTSLRPSEITGSRLVLNLTGLCQSWTTGITWPNDPDNL